MRPITEAESLEIIHRALSGPIYFPVAADDPNFRAQPLPWEDIFNNTTVTKADLYISVMTATESLKPDLERLSHHRALLLHRASVEVDGHSHPALHTPTHRSHSTHLLALMLVS